MRSSNSHFPDGKEWRRFRALERAQAGWKQQAIAQARDASESAVSDWLTTAERHGPQALRAPPRPGPATQLTDEQRRLLPEWLWHGPEAYGFRGTAPKPTA